MPEEHDLDDLVIEAYCVVCKEKQEMENPSAVWTSKGQAATKGICPVCGTNMFRMGRTELHGTQKAPKAIQVVPGGVKGKHVKAAYVAAAVTDAEFAGQISKQLEQLGVYVWLDDGSAEVDNTRWSSGVHPALEQCNYLVVVLSSFTQSTTSIVDAWQHFIGERKKIIVAVVEAGIEPPDELRSRPRFDFAADYKAAFRGLMEMLSG